MKTLTRKSLILLLLLAPATAAAESREATGVLRNAAPGIRSPFALPTRTFVTTTDRPGEVAEPEGLLDPVYVTHVIAGKTVHMVLARASAEAKAPDLLAVDRDGDGVFGPAERHVFPPLRQRGVVGGSYSGVSIAVGESVYSLDVFYGQRGDEPARIVVRAHWFLEAEVSVGGKSLVVAIRDGDLDGTFASADDRWLVREKDGRFRPRSANALSTRDERRFLAGHRIRLAAVEGLGLTVEAEPADGPDPRDLETARTRIARVWREQLEPTRAEFEARSLIDPERPKAMNAVRWERVTFARALELARKDGNPLLVELRSFEGAACYRLDLHTYPDEEVAKLLNQKFFRVQVIREQDVAGDFVRLLREIGGGRLPAMGVWTAEGKLVHRISGYRKPSDLVFELGAALDAVEKAKDSGKGGGR